jgi:quinol monooxygenase YgiN
LPLHFFIQFNPPPDAAGEFRAELLRVVISTRAEPGCRSIRIFESLGQPPRFAIHSEWADEAAFDLHAELPHTRGFAATAERLLRHNIEGLRTKEIMDET